MTKQFRAVFFVCACIFSTGTLLSGQSDNLRVSVANMGQDINLLIQEVKTLHLEVEAVRRENAQLRARVAALSSNDGVQSQIAVLADAIDGLRAEYRQADEAQKAKIIAEVSQQVKSLGMETQAALNSVAKAVSSTPSVEIPVHFSDEYPKTGKPYVVRKGDTLSGIARDHKSTVKHIQNANKIANPAKDLRVGATIFIPIPE
ncbi:MAG: LysM repeat protein [Lentimonas sp.]|jgi:LysM repeat protein